MTLDVAAMKRRRAVMMTVNVIAVLGALAGIVGYFRFGQTWALIAFLGALLVGFGAQIWFIAGLRGSKSSSPGRGA
ncbi:MAG: hypothetical protein ACHP9T_04545 [Caulobacterales bacterium]|jgi:Na+/H+-dicarboxylate symporter